MPKGTVTYWNGNKHFGFIKAQEGDRARDVFVHLNHLAAGLHGLAEGQEVEFQHGVDDRTKRPCARDVRLLP